MGMQKIETKYIHGCDNCSTKHESASESRPKHWTDLIVKRDAYDFQDNACADGSVPRRLCEECSTSIAKVINEWGAGNLPPKFAPIHVVFDGPPSHESGRFVEVEDSEGHGIGIGEWHERSDGLWELRIPGVLIGDEEIATRKIAEEEAREEELANGQFGVGA